MDDELNITPLLSELNELCTAGYAIGLHIKFSTPMFFLQSYNKDWIAHYSSTGMVMHDPIVGWGFDNQGTKRWSDLESSDARGVLKSAKDFGLNYGIVCSLQTNGSRTIGGFARSDRDFTQDEITRIEGILESMVNMTANRNSLTQTERAWLKQLSIMLTHGGSE